MLTRPRTRLVTVAGTAPAEFCAAGRIVCLASPPRDVQRGLAHVAPLIDAGRSHVVPKRHIHGSGSVSQLDGD